MTGTTTQVSQLVLNVFRDAVPGSVFLSTQILGISLGCSRDDWIRVLMAVGGLTTATAEDSIDEAVTWPFVDEVAGEWFIAPGFEATLAQSLRETSIDAYVAAHAFFADSEKRFKALDAEEEWLTLGRLAYYKAPLNLAESTAEFERAFNDAPVSDRTWNRLWLAELVQRQVSEFGAESRIVSFYRGFELYLSGRRASALDAFNRVTASPVHDSMEAISLHLSTLCEADRDSELVVSKLRDSIRKSQRLGLDDNLVRARNTLVWTLVRRARKFPHELKMAQQEASTNLKILGRLEDRKQFEAWLLLASAATDWLVAVGLDRRNGRGVDALFELGEVLRKLSDALVAADADDDHPTALRVLNERAGVHRDVGWYLEAVDDIEEGVVRARSVEPGSPEITGLLKTANSLRGRIGGDVGLSRRIAAALAEFRSVAVGHDLQ